MASTTTTAPWTDDPRLGMDFSHVSMIVVIIMCTRLVNIFVLILAMIVIIVIINGSIVTFLLLLNSDVTISIFLRLLLLLCSCYSDH